MKNDNRLDVNKCIRGVEFWREDLIKLRTVCGVGSVSKYVRDLVHDTISHKDLDDRGRAELERQVSERQRERDAERAAARERKAAKRAAREAEKAAKRAAKRGRRRRAFVRSEGTAVPEAVRKSAAFVSEAEVERG